VSRTEPLDQQPETQPEALAPEPVRRRGRIAAVTGSVLLAGALIAGVGTTVVTVNGADRDAGAARWKFPKATSQEWKAPTPSGLTGMLVPYGTEQFVQGPDIGEFGADARLDGAHAVALRKESLRGLPRTMRKRLEQQIERQRIKGIAMRSYFSRDTSPYVYEGTLSIAVELAQMENTAVVRDIARSRRQILGLLDIDKGPKIRGHKEAACFHAPMSNDDGDLEAILCTAYAGDVLVTVTASGAHPDIGEIARFLRLQLDRIGEPGKAI
jgi:hypothetical protein